MKTLVKIIFNLFLIQALTACGGSDQKKETVTDSPKDSEEVSTEQIEQIPQSPEWTTLNPKKKMFIKNGTYEFSATIHADDSVRWRIEAEEPISSVIIMEERRGKVVCQKKNVQSFVFQKKARYTDVFTVKISDKGSKYYDLIVERLPGSVEAMRLSTDYLVDTTDVKKGAKNAVTVEEVKLVKAVNEPRKIVLSSAFSFSGESRIILPLELPKGTKELLYELRISGEDRESSSDGQLYDKVTTAIDEYKVLGKSVFETKSTGSSLTRELLNEISIPKRERFSANVFFFPDEKNARAFTDRSEKGYNYDTKNSIKNTESLNGLIKARKDGFVYLGLQTTSSFRDTYLWLDAVAIQTVTRYVLLKKKPIDGDTYD